MYGDVAEEQRFIERHVPASLIETTRYVATADKDQPQIVRYVTGRVNYGTDIQSGDRIYDEWADCWYAIDSVSNPGNPVRRMDTRLELKRVT